MEIKESVPLSSSKQDFPAKLSQHHALPRRDFPGFLQQQLSPPMGLGQEGHQGCFHQSLPSSPPLKVYQADSNITLLLTCEIPDQTQPGQKYLHQKKVILSN